MPNVTEKHPRYTDKLPDWRLMRHCYHGERVIKDKGEEYLPYTQNQLADGARSGLKSVGRRNYEAYKKRARFYNFLREAVHMAIGMMHSQPPEINLPERMQGIRGRSGEPLDVVLRNINTEQLISGRIGVLADIATAPELGEDLPYITTYTPERCINWDDGEFQQVPQVLTMGVLDETEAVRETNDLTWTEKNRYRVVMLRMKGKVPIYMQGVFGDEEFSPNRMRPITWRGRTLSRLPFIFVNSCDVTSMIDDPPLLDLANACITLYQSDADYRQNLFMQGQDTLVTIGANFEEDDDVRVGAGSRIDLGINGDAKYIGVTSDGLSEQREAISNLIGMASSMGAQTLDTVSRERESGDSLRIRVAARTADMNHIALTGAQGLEYILKLCAEWMNENPDEVVVKPNLEFGEMPMTGQMMMEMAQARNQGFPISAETMHRALRNRRLTPFSFEDEVRIARDENAQEDFPFPRVEEQEEENPQPVGNS